MRSTSPTTTSSSVPALTGLVVAVDVQHIFRDGIHAGDRGTIYQLENGTKFAEADGALHYGAALAEALRGWGARVITNDPHTGILIGPYSRRQSQAASGGANVYLACHLNAGGGSYGLAEVTEALSLPLARAVLESLDQTIPELTQIQAHRLEHGERGAVCVQGFTRGPAVLLEPLFGDNRSHQRLLSLEGMELVGATIALGVAAWFKRGCP